MLIDVHLNTSDIGLILRYKSLVRIPLEVAHNSYRALERQYRDSRSLPCPTLVEVKFLDGLRLIADFSTTRIVRFTCIPQEVLHPLVASAFGIVQWGSVVVGDSVNVRS